MKGELGLDSTQLKNPERFFTQEEMQQNEFLEPETLEVQGNFWLNLLLRVDLFRQIISEKDKKVLKYLNKIDVLNYINNDNYTIEFYFDENEYFDNDKLTIEILVDEDSDYESSIEEIKAEIIEWKENQNFLVNVVNGEEKRM